MCWVASALLLVVYVSGSVTGWKVGEKPIFCGLYSCPRFWAVDRMPSYDTRCYTYSTWAVTEATKPMQTYFTYEFSRLSSYLKGSNNQRKLLPMTAPVAVYKAYNGTDQTTRSGMGFYLPEKCHTTIPLSKDSAVSVKKMPRFCVYVRKFRGYVLGRTRTVQRNLDQLTKDLENDGRPYKQGESMMAYYDCPFTLFHRHNEVWRFVEASREKMLMSFIDDPEFKNQSCVQ